MLLLPGSSTDQAQVEITAMTVGRIPSLAGFWATFSLHIRQSRWFITPEHITSELKLCPVSRTISKKAPQPCSNASLTCTTVFDAWAGGNETICETGLLRGAQFLSADCVFPLHGPGRAQRASDGQNGASIEWRMWCTDGWRCQYYWKLVCIGRSQTC